MRDYGPGNSNPKITIEQLKRMIASESCPDVFQALRDQVNMILDLNKLNAASVEEIQRMKVGGKAWQISLFTDDHVLQVSGDSAYRYAGDPPMIKLTKVTALYLDGTTQSFKISSLEPQSVRSKPKVGVSVLNLKSEARRRRAPRVSFNEESSRWQCACLYRNELYCQHILTHLADANDVSIFDNKAKLLENAPLSYTFRYPIANGLAEIEALLTIHKGEWLELDDKFVYQITWGGFEHWLASDDGGVTLVHQIEGAVEGSEPYKEWLTIYQDFLKTELPHTPHDQIVRACSYKFHRFTDSKMVMNDLMGHDFGSGLVLMANGFTSLFYHRCLACWRAVNMHELNLPSEDAVPSRMERSSADPALNRPGGQARMNRIWGD